ncbi:TniQ family protein [Streptomyces sp. NPDC127197]|uniref:TniQ family protein n=1 Tax=Streptomyces sp. NPDC127197 TaxID=3345388 RepID=UPI0036343380
MSTPHNEPRPLPRSLAPLHDESVAGYLLRLAHRLGTSPGQITKRTGLLPSGSGHAPAYPGRSLPINLLYRPGEDRIRTFARVTRLTPDEADQLFLAALGRHYGPLNEDLTRRGNSARMLHNNPGLYSRWTRYCPQCLRGDDNSPIQQRHGGSWRRSWRLPPVFACVEHQRLLINHCPACGQAALGGSRFSFIPSPGEEGIHPAQCRASRIGTGPNDRPLLCGADLAQPARLTAAHDEQTMKELLGLQQQILDLLDPHRTQSIGWLVPTVHYFMDLRVMSALVLLSWPATQDLAATAEMKNAVDQAATDCRTTCNELRARGGKRHTSRAFSTLPDDPFAAGAVLHIADRLLATEDDDVFDAIRPVFQAAQTREPEMAGTLRNSPAMPLSQPLRRLLAVRDKPRWRGSRTYIASATDLVHVTGKTIW